MGIQKLTNGDISRVHPLCVAFRKKWSSSV